MKKLLVLALAAVMAATLFGCSSGGDSKGSDSKAESTQASQDIQKSEAVQSSVEDNAQKSGATQTDGAIKPSAFKQTDKYIFTLQQAKRYDEIKGDLLDDTPEESKTYVVLFIKAENVSSEDQYVNILYIDAYEDDTSVFSGFLINKPEGYEMLGGELASGKSMEGFLAYEAPKDWKKGRDQVSGIWRR